MDVHGRTESAVLVPLYEDAAGELTAVFTQRRHDLSRHAAEISFPGGRRDDGEELLAAALASCTAVTMEMYAQRKGWDVAGLKVDCRYSPAERGCPTKFELLMRMPAHLSEDQVDKLQVIAAKCPIHRTLEGEVAFEERVELS